MPLYEINNNCLHKVAETTYANVGVLERKNLQHMLKNNIGVILPDVMIIAEEYCDWEDSRRSIDLLGIDKSGKLIVIELKRTEDGGHMDLQAVRYAAMISRMKFSQASACFQKLKEIDKVSADNEILNFLEWDEIQEDEFGVDVKIVLVSADFSKEITTTAMWLNERYSMGMECIRIKPYQHNDIIFVDVQRIVPLPEAENYQVKIREKAEEEKQVRRNNGRDYTRFSLVVGDNVFSNLPKRDLVYHVMRAAFDKHGCSPKDLVRYNKAWILVAGKHSEDTFLQAAHNDRLAGSSNSSIDRFYTEDERLIFHDGKTFAFTNQWGRRTLPVIEDIMTRYNMDHVKYEPLDK